MMIASIPHLSSAPRDETMMIVSIPSLSPTKKGKNRVKGGLAAQSSISSPTAMPTSPMSIHKLDESTDRHMHLSLSSSLPDVSLALSSQQPEVAFSSVHPTSSSSSSRLTSHHSSKSSPSFESIVATETMSFHAPSLSSGHLPLSSVEFPMSENSTGMTSNVCSLSNVTSDVINSSSNTFKKKTNFTTINNPLHDTSDHPFNQPREYLTQPIDEDHESYLIDGVDILQKNCLVTSSKKDNKIISPTSDRPMQDSRVLPIIKEQSIQSKIFAHDSLLTLSMGQFAHTPFSSMLSISNSSCSPSLASKTTNQSSTFGGFLAKFKDALPGRASTSELSKSSRLERSTTALILQDRQPGLPSKTPEEEAKHRLMYENIIEEVKKKEMRDTQKNMERMKNQFKMEELMSSALKVWKTDLLPYWDDVRNNYNTRQLWWHGIPPSIRGVVWKLVVGNDLNITKELYEICLQRFQELLKTASSSSSSSSSSTSASPSLSKMAIKTSSSSSSSLVTKHADHGPSSLSLAEKENPVSRESSVELIRLDVSRTFPSLCIFQKIGPYHEYLEGLLGAYVCYRPDVGYVQGMSFVAAMLLLNMEAHDAFISFANLLNRPIFIAFFRLDADMMKVYFNTYNFFFKNNMPKLYKHFLDQKLTADLYIIDWVFSLFSKCFNLDIVSRIWDVFFRDGEQFLFRTALGILKLFQPILFNMDFIQMAQFLVRPPESQVDQAELFHSIESIDMECKGLTFRQVLEQFRVNQLNHPLH